MRKRRMRAVVAATAALSLLLGSVAIADELEGWDDLVGFEGGSSINLGEVCLGDTAEGTVRLAIRRSQGGANAYANNSTVMVSLEEASAGLDVGPVSGSIVMPTDWVSSGEWSPSVTSSVAFTPVAVGAFSGTVRYEALGPNSANGQVLSRSETVAVTANVVNCVLDQTIDFPQPTSPQTYGETFVVAPTATSELPVEVNAAGACSADATADAYEITMTSGSGDCTITASQAGNADYNAAEDVVRTVAAALRPVTVTADAQSKVYGEDDPGLTYEVSSGSLVSGDAFSGALSRAPGEDVGTYAIGQGTLALGDNYDITFVGAELTITARAITVTADPKSKVYGEDDPALTYQITAGTLAFNDGFTGALLRAPGENVGTYAIGQGTLALGDNYDITFVGANLTITTAFRFEGFDRPVDMDALNRVKGGSTVPLKFSLFHITDGTPFEGTAGVVKQISVRTASSCQALDGTVNPVEATATGGTGLRSLGDGQYIFNWAVPKKAGACYQVFVETADGQQHMVARFEAR
jgi:hypothetical protein